jgi:hypothetical protein
VNAALRARRLKLIVLTAVTFVVLAMWALAAVSIANARRTAIDNAKTNAENLSAAFAEEINFIVKGIDGAMSLVASKVIEHHGDFNVYDVVDQIKLMTSFAIQASLIGPYGWMRSSTLEPHPVPTDLSDREHFRITADPSFQGIFISKPVTGRVSGQVTIQFARRIESKDGQFLGVLVFSVPPKALTALQKSINVGQHDFIGLIGLDNVVRARFTASSPDGLNGVGQTVGDHPTPSAVSEYGDTIVTRQSNIDHVTRIISNRRVQGYPLVVGVGLDLDDRLAEAHEHARTMLITVGTATLLLGALVIYLMHEIDRRTANENALAGEHQKLEDANISLQSSKERAELAEDSLTDAIECVSEAFVVYDKNDHLVLCNEAYRQLHPQAVHLMRPGSSFEQVMRQSLAAGVYNDAVGREEQWLAEVIHKHQ